MPGPRGPLLATIATVNDVHFGEQECGKLGTPEEIGPVFTTAPGDPPYPEVMNEGAIAEIDALDPAAVVVKGDLTNLGASGSTSCSTTRTHVSARACVMCAATTTR